MGAPVVAAATHGLPAQEPDSQSVVYDRVTKTGRRLWYVLNVIQQPERARACGSGPKSTTDRRPVDPPPVVELRIFEGQTFEQAQTKDITFLHNANFFLYATLEHARVMAHGRVQTPAVNTPPVLTGMPVSGMAYLDRPREAGYFLFPDLSVRHEGRYRLTFNLYEETKEDKDKSEDTAAPADGYGLPQGSFDWVMEVKSQDFVVYSAKKFPGLTESTALSRVVAEQGCRVRIRRDVRMRRRDGKGNADYENAEEEYARRKRTETPEAKREAYRARSMSGSVERTPYSADSQRRGSGVDYASAPPPPPHYHPQTPSSNGHLGFLGGSSSNAQYPSQPFAQPPSVPASPSYPPSQTSSYYAAAPAPPQVPYYPEQRPTSQSFAPIAPPPPAPLRLDKEGAPSDMKRVSLPSISSMCSQDGSAPPPPPSARAYPPLCSPTAALPPPVPTRTNSYSNPSGYQLPPPTPPRVAGQKRTHEETFRQMDANLPRFNGSRDTGMVEDRANPDRLVYTRASGDLEERDAPDSACYY